MGRSVKFRPGFTRHPKIVEAGPLALALYAAAIDFAAVHLTDGQLSEVQLTTLLNLRGVHHELPDLLPGMTVPVCAEELVRRLVHNRLLEEHDGGRFQLHDFTEYQPTRGAVEARRARDAQRKRQYRRAARGDPSQPELSGADVRAASASGPRRTPPGPPHSVSYPSTEASYERTDADLQSTFWDGLAPPLRKLATAVTDTSPESIARWVQAAGGVPSDQLAARAVEELERRRGWSKRGPLVSEARYVTSVLRELREPTA